MLMYFENLSKGEWKNKKITANSGTPALILCNFFPVEMLLYRPDTTKMQKFY